MLTLDAEATFSKLDKLQAQMKRMEKNPNSNEWQYIRLLIRALTEGISKMKKSSTPVSRKVRTEAPEEVRGDWQELVEMLKRKGIQPERRRSSASRG